MITVPAAGRATLPLAPAADGALCGYLAESGLGQPGLDAGRGMGVAPGSAFALCGKATLHAWNADGPDALRLRLRRTGRPRLGLRVCRDDRAGPDGKRHRQHTCGGHGCHLPFPDPDRAIIALDNRFGAADLLRLSMRFFRTLHDQLGAGTYDVRLERDLHSAAGELAEVVGWLEAAHGRLAGHVAALASDAELDAPRPTNWGERRPTRWIVAAMITHDAYHAGEINHLRSTLGTDDRWRFIQLGFG